MPDYRYPFGPFPSGWYALAAASDLAQGQVLRGHWLGRDQVLWRARSGRVHRFDAICPHMGAHFGFGGRVDGESLVCPFHDFAFGGDGSCVRVPYVDGKPPTRARVASHRVLERNGLLLAWHSDQGADPWFDVPEVETDGWSGWGYHTFRGLRAHPQETSENSVDFGHLRAIHRYQSLEVLSPMRTDGAYLTARYAMVREMATLGVPGASMRTAFTVHVHGLGYSIVDVDIPALGVRTQQLVLCTPLDGDTVDLRIGMRWRHDGLSRWPTWLRNLMHRAVLPRIVRAYAHDVAQDVDVWENKVYVHPPQLAKGDGPIVAYRKWAEQFYADPLVG